MAVIDVPFNVRPNDVIEIKTHVLFADQVANNVRHYVVSTAGNPSITLSDIADVFDESLAPLYKTLMTSQAIWRGVSARVIHPISTSAAYWDEVTGNGVAGINPLPKQCCGLISFRGSSLLANDRGRTYVPFPSEEDSVAPDAQIQLAYRDNLAALMTFYLAPQVLTAGARTGTLSPVIWHRATQGISSLLSGQVRSYFATQRRRSAYGPPNSLPV
jgi:hypothetical protein